MLSIDLNCDMGEGCDADQLIMPYITSANIACGFHASDPMTMRKTVELAVRHFVTIGAHPSYPDPASFGRRAMELTAGEIAAAVTYQIGALWAFCKNKGVPLHHVKPHGALYNKAADDLGVAAAIAEAVRRIDAKLILICLSNSTMVAAAQLAGIPYVQEAFADRAYTSQGRLVPRDQPGAVLHDAETIAQRALQMVTEKSVTAIDGQQVPLSFETLCVHGDTAGAVEIVKAIRRKLAEANVAIRPFGR
jgi:5-oxoprolinase (ATP-hydrolysing) subunit A